MNSLIRFSPGTEMRRLQRELDSVFNEFFPVARNGNEDAQWSPRVDVKETENDYTLRLDVPGVQKEDFAIDYHDGTLSVSGERRAEERHEGETMVRVERLHGSFFRSFALPKAVDHDAIRAQYEDGVLTIHVPKAEESKPRRISVN